MKYWVTSDLHLGHNNIIEFCNRPFQDAHEMNKILTNNWNLIVDKSDTVFHLGDFAFKSRYHVYEPYFNGKIIYIKGNHDKEHFIDFLSIEWGKFNFFMLHRPPQHRKEIPDFTDICLCGHVHEKWKHQLLDDVPVINVGIDQWNYKPIDFQQVIKYCYTNKLIKKENIL